MWRAGVMRAILGPRQRAGVGREEERRAEMRSNIAQEITARGKKPGRARKWEGCSKTPCL